VLTAEPLREEEKDRYSPGALLIIFSIHRHLKPHFDRFQLGALPLITLLLPQNSTFALEAFCRYQS